MPVLRHLPAGLLISGLAGFLHGAVQTARGGSASSDPSVAAPGQSQVPAIQAGDHWAFSPIADRAIPTVRNRRWLRTPVDAFILAGLEAAGLAPGLDADRRTWIRRVTFDLIGLPPTPAEINDFIADRSGRASERVVERLLASPHYGERWGRHWLDVVRYADTAGDSSDYPIPQAHKYRDYVIAAFNRDKPYDRFLREQIAGDLLPWTNQAQRNEQVVATGYIAIARRFGVGGNETHLTIEDTLETTGRSVLGLSLGCARCHDHKHDPVTMEDYYGLYGILASTRYPHPGSEVKQRQADFVPLLPEAAARERVEAHRARVEELEAGIARVESSLGSVPPAQWKDHPLRMEFDRLWRERDALNRNPLGADSAYAVADAAATNAHLQYRGDPFQPGREVPRQFPRILGGYPLPAGTTNSGRLEFAHWLTAPSNPLPARVMVNRIWQHHFGRGLVATPNDFGTRGRAPTHPALLDWLAARFIESGWSVKAMHRLIVLSSTYRQSSIPLRQAPADPDNEMLGRFNRTRLDAESLRDALLAVSGRLDRTPGGPHPFPPENEWNYTQHVQFTASYPSLRRTVYLLQQRIRKDPFLEMFDGPDPNASTAARNVTVTPLQALFALNDPFLHEQAAAFAARLLNEEADDRERIERAHQLAFGRPARAEEVREGLVHLQRVAEQQPAPMPPERRRHEAWSSYARVLLGSSEFLFVD